MKKIINILIIFFITIILFIIVDYFFGEKILIKSKLKIDNSFRISNNYYHHGFKKNYKTTNTSWGPYIYTFCSNSYGLRSKCDDDIYKNYDIAIIGDSFTEGVGLNYEDTFVGMLENKTKKKILNLGIVSSSPSLHLKKLKYYLNEGLYFNDLIIAMDLSDLHEELSYNEKYILNSNVCRNKVKLKKNKTNFYFKAKYLIEREFQVTSIILKKIWWQLGLRKINKNFNLNYLNENFYKSAWPYNNNIEEFKNKECIDDLILSTKMITTEIYNLLAEHNINLSILIYPWPGTLIHDSVNSNYVKIWEEFCINKCKNFFNTFPVFFDQLTNHNQNEIIKKYYFDYDVHFNKKGNELLVNHIYENINISKN